MEEGLKRRIIFDGILKSYDKVFLKISECNQYFEKYSNNGDNYNIEKGNIENIDDRPMYLTILTERSIDYDYYNLREEDKHDSIYYDKKYKPYLMYYVIDDKNEIEKIRRIKEHSNNIWITARYVNHNDGDREEKCIKGCLFLNRFINNYNKCLKIECYDVDYNILKKIEDVYDIDIEKYNICRKDIRNLKINIIPKSIRVYNVGHGNINLISGNKTSVLFDIGCPNGGCGKSWVLNRNYKAICRSLMHIIPELVIISHWDIDHYKGYGMLNNEAFNVPWIVPSFIDKGGVNVNRLLIYKNNMKTLYFLNVNQVNNHILYNDNVISIILTNGNGNNDNGIYKKNLKGLYIEIKKRKEQYLLMGDTPYKCANIDKTRLVNLLVVPHHGSNTMSLNNYIPSPNSVNSIAIVCEDEKKTNRCSVHMDELSNKGFNVYFISGNNYKSNNVNNYYKWFEYDIDSNLFVWE